VNARPKFDAGVVIQLCTRVVTSIETKAPACETETVPAAVPMAGSVA
jgi:hypothetical protein